MYNFRKVQSMTSFFIETTRSKETYSIIQRGGGLLVIYIPLYSRGIIISSMIKRIWSPGLVVVERDSCSRGCELKSEWWILNGSIFTFISCKILLMLEQTEMNGKEAVGYSV